MQLVRVALALPLMRLFDYLLPAGQRRPPLGARVRVPFGRQQKIGILVDFPAVSEVEPSQLKQLSVVLDQQSLFATEMWHMLNWAAGYYQAPLGEVLFSALPSRLRRGESAAEQTKILWKITALGRQALSGGELSRMKKQQEALQALCQAPLEKGNNTFATSIWAKLKSKDWVQEVIEEADIIPWHQSAANIVNPGERLSLNKQQALALSQLIFHQGFAAWLLEGVTGSGKTEIYLQLIEETLKKGCQVLVLVPEIGLTPQTLQRFRARFSLPVDALHSELNDTQRLQVWQRARSGQSAIVIGTRSALFTPFERLGLIVIDEEHDPSFKQQEGGWRYHARDLAVLYAKQQNIPVLMGSATPSLESLHNVARGKYRHLVLSQRAGSGSRLSHQLIDLKGRLVHKGLSETLLRKMGEHLEKGNQVLLFLNRRGFAPVLLCHECGWMASCPHCDKTYTYYHHQRILRCHHCGGQHRVPMQCRDCGSTHLITTGLGTEQLEEMLSSRFPQFGITRIDRDTTARKGHLEQHLSDIRQGKSRILIGTQMLAKGHHFPDVTLVALVNVDSALFSLDFRAEERLAQLYVQVAGRAGRAGKPGEVILQTHYPEHPLLQLLLQQGYPAFARQALLQRQSMGLPPFSAQALFHARSRNEADGEKMLQQLADYFLQSKREKNISGLEVLGPMPAPLAKKSDQFRWQLLLQHPSKGVLQHLLTDFQSHFEPKFSSVRWSLDVDPLDLS
ncbi:replication restart DNA helicase PriA [Mesocricetibacter intestinalis]|uniref:Replication restart protein PriA n=1 Tax=Mesocricetibacter intestinalis TaxID=1521930 RepID=A0A4R6V911_9PAST|nr:primosomal protein N' [Mesocricetibacter intestinalis]TDQ58068.1 replication restart DNA helicase PriA [Mesocricetibacter intestinalis]